METVIVYHLHVPRPKGKRWKVLSECRGIFTRRNDAERALERFPDWKRRGVILERRKEAEQREPHP